MGQSSSYTGTEPSQSNFLFGKSSLYITLHVHALVRFAMGEEIGVEVVKDRGSRIEGVENCQAGRGLQLRNKAGRGERERGQRAESRRGRELKGGVKPEEVGEGVVSRGPGLLRD